MNVTEQTLEALKAAARLEELGIVVKSPELAEAARETREFVQRGGNRQMRRNADRARRAASRYAAKKKR
jgi:hypothetical protein